MHSRKWSFTRSLTKRVRGPSLSQSKGESVSKNPLGVPFEALSSCQVVSPHSISTVRRSKAVKNIKPYFDTLISKASRFVLDLVLNTLKFPRGVNIRILHHSECPSRPHVSEVAINVHSFRLGLKLPIQPFIRNLLSHMGVALIQPHPHFFKFAISCRDFWITHGWGDPDFEYFGGILQTILTSHGSVVAKS